VQGQQISLFYAARLMAGRFLFGMSTNNHSAFVVCTRGNIRGGDIVKKNPGGFTKYIAAIIAARWIRKTDADKSTKTKESKQKEGKTNSDCQR